MTATAALSALALLWLVSYVPGWAMARAARERSDGFTCIAAGLVLTSLVGLALGHAGWFSLAALLGILGGLSVVCVAVGAAGPAPQNQPSEDTARAARVVATLAAFATIAWSWPPFETVVGGADSTMYVNAGAHLARTGSLAVPETVTSMLPDDIARALFPSVALGGGGPFIRLPGGLLMRSLGDAVAMPAFFPLLPVWAGVSALGGGAGAAPLVAPLFTALAVYAVVLLVGEAFGARAAAVAAVAMVANFAVWWFAKFPMPEPLAAAALWGGVVVLRRASGSNDGRLAFLAGALFGLAGLARTETFLFVAAAGVLAWTWGRMRAPVRPVLLGFALLASCAVLAGERTPSHHLAYLRNDVMMHYYWVAVPLFVKARANGALVAATAVLTLLFGAAAIAGARSGAGPWRGMMRLVTVLGVAVVLAVYVQIGGPVFPWRDIRWLAGYCSWPLLVLALLGSTFAWRRDDALRAAGFAWAVATLVFVLNPRVAAYQPWAIRRFLPIVIPGIAIAGAAAIAALAADGRRGTRWVAVAMVILITGFEVAPVLRARGTPYYAGNQAMAEALADRFPPNAIVAMDSDLADVQLQVPLWLVAGRETLMLREGGTRWRQVMRALVTSGRPVFWIAQNPEPPRDSGDLHLEALAPGADVAIVIPDAPADTPPARKVTRLLRLRIYRVGAGDGVDLMGDGGDIDGTAVGSAAGSMPFRSPYSSRVTTRMKKDAM